MKAVKRAFMQAEGSAKESGAEWEAYALKEYFDMVVKKFIGGRAKVIEQFKSDVVMQCEAKALAQMYNAAGPPKKIDVLEPVILLRASGEVYHAEQFLLGEFFKHNDPAANILGMQEGFADENNYIRMTPKAFSHFTWHATGGKKLVMDVQGVGDTFTDPQIISAEGGKYGVAGLDNGAAGLVFFACRYR
jgi:elongation factor 2 kinase